MAGLLLAYCMVAFVTWSTVVAVMPFFEGVLVEWGNVLAVFIFGAYALYCNFGPALGIMHSANNVERVLSYVSAAAAAAAAACPWDGLDARRANASRVHAPRALFWQRRCFALRVARVAGVAAGRSQQGANEAASTSAVLAVCLVAELVVGASKGRVLSRRCCLCGWPQSLLWARVCSADKDVRPQPWMVPRVWLCASGRRACCGR